ncbi:MAG TPA: nitrate reductase molybdenum cofactor assembly chaperone [Marmoricola sp.]|nr:nitrate reductase molybdenum cofactor assembly chaperone [Marmoricola sp.]
MSRKPPQPSLSDDQLTVAWQSASLLLNYPDERLLGQVGMIRAETRRLPEPVGGSLRAFLTHLESAPLEELQAEYVETFDTRRRCNLFLTYFAHGDTRKRGVALLRFKQTYLRSGFVLDGSELPDHLCVVLEYAALVDHELGRQLMLDHRAGLELLRLSLADMESPWSPVVDALCATFPRLRGDEQEAIRRLAAEGPPEEEVGLTPYATPGFDPGPAVPSGPPGNQGPALLPMPSFPGAR